MWPVELYTREDLEQIHSAGILGTAWCIRLSFCQHLCYEYTSENFA
jgi:hypothetical protein